MNSKKNCVLLAALLAVVFAGALACGPNNLNDAPLTPVPAPQTTR